MQFISVSEGLVIWSWKCGGSCKTLQCLGIKRLVSSLSPVPTSLQDAMSSLWVLCWWLSLGSLLLCSEACCGPRDDLCGGPLTPSFGKKKKKKKNHLRASESAKEEAGVSILRILSLFPPRAPSGVVVFLRLCSSVAPWSLLPLGDLCPQLPLLAGSSNSPLVRPLSQPRGVVKAPHCYSQSVSTLLTLPRPPK